MPSATAADPPACTEVELDEGAAFEIARRCGTRVEILGARTETAQTFARPDGRYTTEESAEPRWSRQADGTWVSVDLTLQAAGDGTAAPRASVLPVVFSGGGSGPVARVRDGARELALTWPHGSLPAPVLSGADATYPEVLPGVDLRFTASALGFSQVLVVKSRAAAQHSALDVVKFSLTTVGVTADETGSGGLEAKDAQGQVVFTSPVPVMWESGPAVAARRAAAEETAEPRRVTMPVSVDDGALTVVPDGAMLADPTTNYPVFIDPSWTGRLKDNAWTTVLGRSDVANTSFWQNNNALHNSDVKGGAGAGRTCDSVYTNGTCASVQYPVRSYFQMDLSQVTGKHVFGASFRLQQQWAWTCGNGGSNAGVWITNGISPATTWNNQPGWWGNEWSASAPANHRADGQFGCLGTGDVEFDVTHMVRQIAAGGSYITLGMRAWDEGAVNQWKRYNASTPILAIDYNTPANTPDTLTVDGRACATGAARPVVPTATPTLRARVSDNDGAGTMWSKFEVARVREDGNLAPTALVEERGGWSNGAIADSTVPLPPDLPVGVLDRSETILGTGDWDDDGHPDVIARDEVGNLYLFPGDGTRLGTRVWIGNTWNQFTVAGIADWDNDGKLDIVARDNADGELYLYPGQGTRVASAQPRARIGGGFGPYTFAGVADWDRDGKADLVARENTTGTLYLYPGEGTRAASAQPRASLGDGWGGFAYYGVIDRTGDAKPDLVAEYNGELWLYLGSGTRSPHTGSPYRHQIGAGWANAAAFTTPDVNGDGAVDVVAHLPGRTNWLLYPGVVGTGYGGQQWPIAGVGLADSAIYAYRATASDGFGWTNPSAWCEFSVDLTNPTAPTVASQVYKQTGCPQTGCGSLGVADTFTFGSSPDVVAYRWGFTNPPTMLVQAPSMGAATSVRWTPPSSGQKTLYVAAVDRAGRTGQRTHQFTVAAPTTAVGQWMYGDEPGYDATDNGRDLAVSGVVGGLPGRTVGGVSAAGFGGTVNSFGARSKVLDTGKGFSVSAWVKLTPGTTGGRTVVSQQGTTNAAFRLGWDGNDGKWVFALAETDTTNPAYRKTRSDIAGAIGVWTHLMGTYDSHNREIRLYVDGALQSGIASVTTGFDAAGELWVGRGLVNGTAAEPWSGELFDVRAWNRTVGHSEVAELVDPTGPGSVGVWTFNESVGVKAHDTSPYAHDLTLTLAPGASWGQGVTNSGLHLDGSGSANSAEAVLHTDQSFSVDVHAKLHPSGIGAQRTVVAQRGASGVDPFALRYDGARWVAEMPNASTNPTTWWRASSTADAVADDWTHLTVAYDAAARTLRLWVDDVLQSTATGVVGWNSTGVLSVGRGSGGAYWFGDIDELRAHQGVLAARPLTTAAPGGSSVSGDANAELMSVDADGIVRAFLNVNGTYPVAPQGIGSGWTPPRTRFADIDGDGKNEIISLDANQDIRAFPNANGMNGFPFAPAVVIGKATSDPARTTFADIDGDGRSDRIAVDEDGRVRAYRNLFGLNARGQSTAFSTTPVILAATSAAPGSIRFADIDGDHKAEFITTDANGTVLAHRNLAGFGFGTYDGYQEIGYGFPADRLQLADVSGDGRAEIILVRTDGTVWSWSNVNGLTGFPYGTVDQVGSGWHEPARVFFG